ncbi:Protein of unknown function [Cotesia congregata]|uniref:Uncharacterized protein n=1 Tax=Cotesia congregata TaxID=51543 RepID=A0A8J2HQI3_COTCN|nr:Protein of unknown function [Cotesia congregata]
MRTPACLSIYFSRKTTRPRVRSRGPLKPFTEITSPCARNRCFRESPERARGYDLLPIINIMLLHFPYYLSRYPSLHLGFKC